MSFIATTSQGRAPKKEEQLVLAAMRAHDTPEQLVQVPCGVHLNGISYLVVWSENPPENLPDGFFDKYYNSGRCANCGRYRGDHQYGSKEFTEMVQL
jgi:hypothetical protein